MIGDHRVGVKLLNVGFGNMVLSQRIVAIVRPESSPIKRLIQDAKERGRLIDGTNGRRTRAVIITDSDHIVLSAVMPDTVAHRLSGKEQDSGKEPDMNSDDNPETDASFEVETNGEE